MYYAFLNNGKLSITESYDNSKLDILFKCDDKDMMTAFKKGWTLKGSVDANEFFVNLNGADYGFYFNKNKMWQLWRMRKKNDKFIMEFPILVDDNILVDKSYEKEVFNYLNVRR